MPNSKLRAVLPDPLPPVGYGSPRGIMAYSGGAFDTKRDRLIVWGGGHADYSGNEVYVFAVNTLAWQRLTNPSRPTPEGAPSAYINADGTPVSVHSYDGLEYLPALDKLWATGGSRWFDGRATPLTWTFDFTTLKWERKADIIPPGTWTELEVVSAYDPVTGHVFMASPSLPLHEYDPQADRWTQRGPRHDNVGYGKVAAIDPVRRKFVAIGKGQVLAYHLAPTGLLTQQVLPTRGDTTILHTKYPGFEYDPIGRQFVAWNGGADVYTLNLDTLTWTKHPPVPTNTVIPTAEGSRTFGRFRHVPSKNVFVVVNSIDENVYFYKLTPGPGSPPPPHTTPPRKSITSPTGPSVSGTITVSPTAADDVGVIGVQFRRDGVNLGAEKANAPYAMPWDTTPVSDGPHVLSAEARDAAGNTTAASMAITAAKAAQPPPPPSSRQIDIPLKEWVALPLPEPFRRGVKHMTGAFNPDDGRLYFIGGDHGGGPDTTPDLGDSYRQEVHSLSLAERFAERANPAAGFKLEYPYCGPPGQVQPKHPDFVGWTWDSKRHLFWMVPGTMVVSEQNCPGETGRRESDPGFFIDHIMTFNPRTRKWAAIRHIPYRHVEQWMSVYDPKTDTLIRPNDSRMEIYDIAKGTWAYVPLGRDARGRGIDIYGSALGADLQGRAIYAIDHHSGRLYRYRMDAKRLEDLGAVPGGPTQYELNFAHPFLVWDSVNEVVLWHRYPDGFFAYHPERQTWETLPTASDLRGIIAAGRVMAFDAQQNVVVLFGMGRIGDLTPPPLAALLRASAPYMFLFRYGEGPANRRPSTPARPPGQPAPPQPPSSHSIGMPPGSAVPAGVPSRSATAPTPPARGKQLVVKPSDPWCELIKGATPGDEIIFTPGSYTEACWIAARGTAIAPITIRSQAEALGQRATFAYPGSASEVIELRDAAHLIIRGFSFGPMQADVDAIRIRRASDVVIEGNTFQGIGGISIAANNSNTRRITVRGNTFKDLRATGIYFGCHNGRACQATDFRIEGNLIDGVTTPFDPNAIGYGIEVKLNSYGVIRDNTIYRTKGPGIMVYGSSGGDPANRVEGNYVEGSATEGGIVIGGGPAIVRNNVLVGNAYGGVSAQNYAGRNLRQNIWIVHNTLLRNADSGINVQDWIGGGGNIIAYNAILPSPGTPALRPLAPSGTIVGNITCGSAATCFVNATTPPYDLWPASVSSLVDAAGEGPEPWRPADDFMGFPRGTAADVGAFERALQRAGHLVGGGRPRPPRLSRGGDPGEAAGSIMTKDGLGALPR